MTFFTDKPIRLTGKKYAALRAFVYERDGECCVRCGIWVRLEGGYLESMHLAHKIGRGVGGDDTPLNTEAACVVCHIGIEHSYGKSGIKPCPPKVAA